MCLKKNRIGQYSFEPDFLFLYRVLFILTELPETKNISFRFFFSNSKFIKNNKSLLKKVQLIFFILIIEI